VFAAKAVWEMDGCKHSLELLIMSCVLLETSINFGIINSIIKLHLVGISTQCCTELLNL
jgi:hypothetical protein